MATEKEFVDALDQARTFEKRSSMAEIVGRTLKGRIVEIYVGDTFEDIKYDDCTSKSASVLVGRVIDAYAELIVLDCAYTDQLTRKLQFGNIICLNERSIRFLTEIDEKGMLRDTFINTRDGKLLKDFLMKQKNG